MRLTIVQYAGDYREAFDRFAKGGKETYYAQRYSVNMVGSLARQLDQVTVICALTETKYDLLLDNGVRAIGAGLKPGFDAAELLVELIKTKPTRLALMAPLVPCLKWAIANQIRAILPLADSFQKTGLREAFRKRRLVYYLNKPSVEWVGNHGINACLSLLDMGVAPDKIIPWDWPPAHRPSDYAVRSLRETTPRKLLYVGSVVQTKGVGDLLQAMARLREWRSDIFLSTIGKDTDGTMRTLARSLKLDNSVDFLGILPNEDIPTAMRAADVVVIPSRHEYPEGLPLTIYEALSARTPIVASDHPMFRGALVDGESAAIFRAGDPDHLAAIIDRLLNAPVLYQALSLNSEVAWNRLQLPVCMGALLKSWLASDSVQANWLRAHRLTSGIYDERIKERRAALKDHG